MDSHHTDHPPQTLKEEVARLSLALEQAQQAAAAAESAKKYFLVNMRDEICSPMNGMLGMLKLLSQSPLDPRQQGYLKNALAAAELMLSTINTILDFARLDAGETPFESIPFDLVELIENTVSAHAAVASQKQLQLNWSVNPEVARQVSGDPAQLQNVLNNLLSNAIKFTKEGEVLLYVAKIDDRVQFGVVDTGVGIDEDVQQQLLNPFEQSSSASNHHRSGTGLGLAICDRLITGMGGTLQIASAPGFGSEFSFSLYLPPNTSVTGKIAPPPLRILVASESRHLRTNVRQILKSHGYSNVAEVGDLLDLRAALFNTTVKCEVLIIDLSLHQTDSQALINRLRDEPRLKQLRIIVLLNANATWTLEHIDACLQKPLKVQELIKALGILVTEQPVLSRQTSANVTSNPMISNDTTSANGLNSNVTSNNATMTATVHSDVRACVDFDSIKKRLGSGSHILPRLLAMFRSNNLDTGAKLAEAIRKGDWGSATMIAQALKSNSGNIAAVPLYEAAEKLELALQEMNRAHIDALMPEVDRRLTEALNALALYEQTTST